MLKSVAAAAAFLAASVAVAVADAAERCAVGGNGVVLTVAGAIEQPNRGPFDEALDRFHAFRGNTWEKARAFTLDDLAALPRARVTGVVSKDGKAHAFEGPTLADVLTAAGADASRTAAIQGIDGYEVELTPAIRSADSPVLALCLDGRPMGLGGAGPVYYIVPVADGAKPTQEQADRQVWGLHYIAIR